MFSFLAKSNIIINSMISISYTPPNSSKDLKVGPKVKQQKKKESWGMFPNSQHFEGTIACWSFEMGLG
jgi:hypothetical protein